MKNVSLTKPLFARASPALVAVVLALTSGMALAAATKVTLSGDQEVPPVKTSASGNGTITVGDDKSVSGSVTTSGIAGTAAHIHDAAAGKNGPVAVPLTKTSDNVWSVPPGSKFNDAQYKSYKAGHLYVNVHSEAHKDGEIRGQLKP
jgi:hypothetical protein